MIPKIIHMIWIGTKSPPQWCIDSWKINYINKYPDWTFMLWNDDEINKLEMINKEIYDLEPTLRGKSDIARMEILYQYGGIFLDADSFWIEKENSNLNILLEKTKENEKEFFCANEPVNKQYFANGVFGCTKNNDIVFQIINYLKDTYKEEKKKHSHKYSIWLVLGPVPFTKIVNKNIEKIEVFPSCYFFPESYKKDNRSIKLEDMKTLFPNSFMYQYWLSHTDEFKE